MAKLSRSDARKILALLLAIVMVIGGQSAHAQVLLHDYNFTSGNGDDSVGNANGVVTGYAGIGNSQLYTGASPGAGLEITGPDVANSAVAGITGSFTLEDFVTTQVDYQNWTILFGFGETTSAAFFSHNHRFNTGPATIEIYSPSSGGAILYLTPGPLPTGVEQMVALTYDAPSNVVTAYLNGAPVSSATFSGPFDLSAVAGTAAGGIGGFDPFGDPSFNGSTRNFAIYSGALSDTQIAQAYANGGPLDVPEPGTWAMFLLGVGSLLAIKKRRIPSS